MVRVVEEQREAAATNPLRAPRCVAPIPFVVGIIANPR